MLLAPWAAALRPYDRTSSLFLVGLVHATSNAVANGSGFSDGFLVRLYPDSSLVGSTHVLAIGVLGLLVVVATRGRLGLGRPAPVPALSRG